jgi:L-asparaginase
MKKILIINTGGTFNKTYNPLNGTLEIKSHSNALDTIASKWLCDFEILHIIGKDSLEMTNQDRLELLGTISQSSYHSFIVIHGTDTMDISAAYIDEAGLEKQILFTGAMVPYAIDPVEATANFASAYGYMQALKNDGVYIAMNGIIDAYHKIKKDRKKGKFTL